MAGHKEEGEVMSNEWGMRDSNTNQINIVNQGSTKESSMHHKAHGAMWCSRSVGDQISSSVPEGHHSIQPCHPSFEAPTGISFFECQTRPCWPAWAILAASENMSLTRGRDSRGEEFSLYPICGFSFTWSFRDRGVKSLKIRGGWKFEFPGASEIDPFLQRFYRKSSIWESKVQVFEGQLSGRVPPPSSVRYVLTPPIPVSDLRSFSFTEFSIYGVVLFPNLCFSKRERLCKNWQNLLQKRVVRKESKGRCFATKPCLLVCHVQIFAFTFCVYRVFIYGVYPLLSLSLDRFCSCNFPFPTEFLYHVRGFIFTRFSIDGVFPLQNFCFTKRGKAGQTRSESTFLVRNPKPKVSRLEPGSLGATFRVLILRHIAHYLWR